MTRRFWAAVSIQAIILLAMVAMHSYTLLTGQPVLLRSAPIDPWDPFRGEYVELRYDISELNASTLPMDGAPYAHGQRIWVTLRPAGRYWEAVALSDRRPESAANEVAIRGRITWIEQPGGDAPGRIHLRYGIEQFYVPEGQGEELEGRRVELEIAARVDATGRAAIERVYLDGEPIEWR